MEHDFENKESKFEYPEPVEVKAVESSEIDPIESADANIASPLVKKNGFKTFKTVALSVFLTLVVIILSICVYALFNKNFFPKLFKTEEMKSAEETSKPTATNIILENIPANSKEMRAYEIYEKISPSVVGVVVYDSTADIISGAVGEGTGIIINENGYIITNAHVINNSKKTSVKIVLNKEDEADAKIIGYDTRTDLAVLKIEKTGLPAAIFGNSDEVKVGSDVLVLGNPGGQKLASSLTKGIVSGINRSLNNSKNPMVKFIQTDAAINVGNSGGPMLDMLGRVIGVTSMKIRPEYLENTGFAIPSNKVKSVVDDIIAKGYVTGRVRIGITAKEISHYQAQIYDVPIGIIVASIAEDSSLKNSKINAGDIITKINDVKVTSFDDFYSEINSHKPGDTVILEIYRPSPNRSNSKEFTTEVTLLEDKGETLKELKD